MSKTRARALPRDPATSYVAGRSIVSFFLSLSFFLLGFLEDEFLTQGKEGRQEGGGETKENQKLNKYLIYINKRFWCFFFSGKMASSSNSRRGQQIAVPEMGLFCFDVLYCQLHGLDPPRMPSFTNEY